MQTFHFVHEFQAPAMSTIFDAYFDPAFALVQDQEVEITERKVIEETASATEYYRLCRVVPKRQLPAIFKPLVAGELHYTEALRWFKNDNRMQMEIRPSLLKGRAGFNVDYKLFDDGAAPRGWRRIRRVYEGTVSIDVPLLGGRIEKGVIADLEGSLRTTAQSTQAWIDANRPRPD